MDELLRKATRDADFKQAEQIFAVAAAEGPPSGGKPQVEEGAAV